MKLIKHFLFIAGIFTGNTLLAQEPTAAICKKKMDSTIASLARLPVNLMEQKVTVVFSVRLTFSTSQRLTGITASEFTPRELKAKVTDTSKYANIDWDCLLGKNIRDGGILLLPIAIYCDGTSTTTTSFAEYTLDGLFNYGNNAESFLPVIIGKPVVVKYSSLKQ